MSAAAPRASSLIYVGRLVKRYDDKSGLDGFSMSVDRGETCAIIGCARNLRSYSGLLDSMSVFDNVAFPLLEARQLSTADVNERMHLTLRELDIHHAASNLTSASAVHGRA